MGYLFENMEKMDIQEERRNTAKAKRDAESAKRDAENAKKDAKNAKEKSIQLVIEAYQESAVGKETILQKLQDKFQMTREEAATKLDIYWK